MWKEDIFRYRLWKSGHSLVVFWDNLWQKKARRAWSLIPKKPPLSLSPAPKAVVYLLYIRSCLIFGNNSAAYSSSSPASGRFYRFVEFISVLFRLFRKRNLSLTGLIFLERNIRKIRIALQLRLCKFYTAGIRNSNNNISIFLDQFYHCSTEIQSPFRASQNTLERTYKGYPVSKYITVQYSLSKAFEYYVFRHKLRTVSKLLHHLLAPSETPFWCGSFVDIRINCWRHVVSTNLW